MDIRLDLSFVPYELRSSIINTLNTELNSQNNVIDNTESKLNSTTSGRNEDRVDNFTPNNDQVYAVRWLRGSIKDFKFVVEKILRNNHNEYMVAEDTDEVNTLTILKQGDVEQFGMHMCTHCGTLFKSEEERTVHERIHYFM